MNKGIISIGLLLISVFASAEDKFSLDDLRLPDDAVQVMDDQAKASDAIKWVGVGKRWAATVDASGKYLAVYDLSYSNLLTRLHLGRCGKNEFTSKDVKDALNSESDGLNSSDEKILNKALKQLSEETAFSQNGLPENWWKSISWENESISKSQDAPSVFNLGEIKLSDHLNSNDLSDMEAMANEGTMTTEKFRFNVRAFLKQFVFEKQPDGSYEMYFVPNTDLQDPEAKASMPKKMIDFKSPKAPMYSIMAWKAVQSLVNQIIKKVNLPVIGSVFELAVGKYFDYQDQMLTAHQLMVVEQIVAAVNEESFSSFTLFSPDELIVATKSVSYSMSGMFGLVKWWFKNPLKEFDKMLEDEIIFEQASRQWFADHKTSLIEWAPRFMVGENIDHNKYVYLTSRECRFKMIGGLTPNLEAASNDESFSSLEADKKKPYTCGKNGPKVSINYQNLKKETERREHLKRLGTFLDYTSGMIPMFGSVVNFAYGYFVLKPIELTQEWEARLMNHLEERVLKRSENRDAELDTLYSQRLNPRELSREGEEKLIKMRRHDLGIGGLN